MKTLTTLFALFVAFTSIAQNQEASIQFLDADVLYRGFENKVRVTVTNNDEGSYILSGVNAVISKAEEGDYFIVKPTNTSSMVKLTVSLKDDEEIQPLISSEYKLYNLPDPTIHWGEMPSGGDGNIKAKNFSVKYPPECTLNIPHNILSWEMSCGTETISGEGSSTESAEEFLMKIPSQSIILITAVIEGPDGIRRMKKGQWKVNSWAEETEFNPVKIK